MRKTGRCLRLPANWTDRRSISDLPMESRWHLLRMLEYCIRSRRYNGRLPLVWAHNMAGEFYERRDASLNALVAAGLVRIEDDDVQIVDPDEYMPRSDAQAAMIRRDNSHLLYRFFDNDGVLLYVGKTYDLKERVRQHRRVQPWWPEVARHEVETFSSGAEQSIAEVVAIQTEKPKYNVQYADGYRTA